MLQSLFGRKQNTNVKNINAKDLFERLDTGERLVLVDVRSAWEYSHDGHIPGSRLLPLGVLMQRSSELPKDVPIVCVCRSGSRSHAACEQLAALGFSNVTNLAGGMIGWKSAGLPYNQAEQSPQSSMATAVYGR